MDVGAPPRSERLLGLPVTPATRRRADKFKANRRGYVSLLIFLALFALSLMAEVIANDKPLVIHYDGDFFFPILQDYQETDFGGSLPIQPDYRSDFMKQRIASGGWWLWPPIPYAYDTIISGLDEASPVPPSAAHWLGTDDQARDVVARIIYGFRISVLFGLLYTAGALVIGVAIGGVMGYFGGRLDLFGQRAIEIWSAIPTLYVLIILATVLTPSFWLILGINLLFAWMAFDGVVRAEFLRARNFDYIKAARALGLSHGAIMRKHVLPNAMVATLTFLPFVLNAGITTLTALDFLGFGLPPGAPSLGELVLQGKNNLQAPWLGITAFLTLAFMLSLLIFIGEALRDAFDPRRSGQAAGNPLAAGGAAGQAMRSQAGR